jgi:hypothetical protein
MYFKILYKMSIEERAQSKRHQYCMLDKPATYIDIVIKETDTDSVSYKELWKGLELHR